MTMVQWKIVFGYLMLSYEHFYLPNLPSKLGLKNCSLPQQLEWRCGPMATVTSLKATWNEGPDQALQGKRLSSKKKAATQRSRPSLKPEKLLIIGILAKRGPHENFLESFNFTNG